VRRGKAKRVFGKLQPIRKRPILRAELFDKLRERMKRMLQAELKW
jgi:hypothetical protein